jgi:hypothetical protein
MERTEGGFFETFTLTTPFGRAFPSPDLECAELSMFMRITFAAWHNLPLSFEAVDQNGDRVFFGHFGVRTAAGRYGRTAAYKTRYADHTSMSPAEYEANWPVDSKLRGRKLAGGSDTQTVFDEQGFGRYLDEIHLNKRVGHFTMLALAYLGSVNLADSANTYNIVADVVRAGDTLIERWQRRGIGHTLVVKEVLEIGEGNLDVTVLSGSMPRRQGKWESGVASKGYFTGDNTGGEGENFDGEEYVKLGGGIKRYRVAKPINGFYMNTFMRADEAHWINSTDWERLKVRPARFDQILGQVPPEELMAALLAKAEDARNHLRRFPASCSARERRERAMEDVYDVAEREFGINRAQIDAEHRPFEDEVFAELEYNQSKTCCWNSTTASMFEIIMDFANKEREEAEAEGTCRAPTVFMNHADEYNRWRQFAEDTNRGAQWVPWSEDESCSQRNVATDTERIHAATPFCDRSREEPTETCGDSFGDNNTPNSAAELAAGSTADLSICDGRSDYYLIAAAGTLVIEFEHDNGDLDMAIVDSSGEVRDDSTSTDDSETLAVGAGDIVKVYGFSGATNTYSITLM